MKDFWNENKGIIGKLVLNQFGAAFFGLMLILAASSAAAIKEKLQLIASIIAVVFYLFLLYNVMWDKGGKDRIRVDGGRATAIPLKGLYCSLVANAFNLLLFVLIFVSYFFKGTATWAATTYLISRTVALLWEGMYNGIVMYFSPYNPIIYLLMVFPALFICALGYYLGQSNKKLFGFLNQKQENKKA